MKFRNIFILVGIFILLPSVSAIVDTYSMPIATLTSTPTDSLTTYFGYNPSVAPGTQSNQSIVFIPHTGYIDTVEIYDYSGTAGTNEEYAYYIRIRNTTDYLVQKLSVNTNERIFTNTSINIPVTAGDWWEIKRVHPAWGTNPATNIVGGYVLLNTSTTTGFYIPIEALSSDPADSVRNHLGYRPAAVSTAQGTNKIYIHEDGNITVANIIMNTSLRNGTSEVIPYYVQKNGGDNQLIGTYDGFNDTFRNLTNQNVGLHVEKGDYIEVYRDNPAWVVNPTSMVTMGGLWVDTSQEQGCKPDGYKLYAQALTSSPSDGVTVYFGSKLSSPDTTSARDKLFIRKAGFINFTKMYVYSGTAGTTENWNMYIRLNNAADYFIARINSSANERIFRNATISIPVAVGDYIQFKGVQPTWATNPATTVYGGWVYVETASVGCSVGGGDIVLPVVSNFSANVTSTTVSATVKFFDQSNNTIPGTTLYYWNFTGIDGGKLVDSTNENPTFSYTSTGTYTINHTVESGAVISKSSGIVTITGGGGDPLGPPNASFNIVLTDTSTNSPTAWKWNATNISNNTEITFSTLQNPVLSFGTLPANWRINFTASNALGSNTTNQTIGYNLTTPVVYFWSRTA